MTSVTIPVTPVPSATIDDWIDMYWPGLKTQLDAIAASLYTDLVSNATTTLSLFDYSFLTTAQEYQAKALLVCVDCGGAPGISGWSQERHYNKLKVYDRTWQNDDKIDWAIGELCRLLKITPKEYNAKTSTVRTAQYNKYRTSSIYISPDLDQRGKVFRDYDLTDLRDDREAYPLDNRFI